MATLLDQSLKSRFAALQAERERTWPPAQLAANLEQRRKLVERFDARAVAQVGDRLPAVTLDDVDGGALSLADLAKERPLVLVLFRYAGCPACNIALKYYQEELYPALAGRGVALVAVSPQRADLLHAIKDRHSLGYTVASDRDSGLADHLGVSFVPDDRPSPPPPGWIGEVTGTGRWDLPQPTVLIVDRERTIRWLRVSPDWLDRPEAEDILSALDSL